MRKGDAKLRYYLHISDPDSLTDEEWAKALRNLEWIWEMEAKAAAERQQK